MDTTFFTYGYVFRKSLPTNTIHVLKKIEITAEKRLKKVDVVLKIRIDFINGLKSNNELTFRYGFSTPCKNHVSSYLWSHLVIDLLPYSLIIQ